jgi:hypothetical protein
MMMLVKVLVRMFVASNDITPSCGAGLINLCCRHNTPGLPAAPRSSVTSRSGLVAPDDIASGRGSALIDIAAPPARALASHDAQSEQRASRTTTNETCDEARDFRDV